MVAAELRERHLERLAAAPHSAKGDPELELAAFIDAHLAVGGGSDPKQLACWIMIGAEAIRSPRVRVEYEATLRALMQKRVAETADPGSHQAFVLYSRDAGVRSAPRNTTAWCSYASGVKSNSS